MPWLSPVAKARKLGDPTTGWIPLGDSDFYGMGFELLEGYPSSIGVFGPTQPIQGVSNIAQFQSGANMTGVTT